VCGASIFFYTARRLTPIALSVLAFEMHSFPLKASSRFSGASRTAPTDDVGQPAVFREYFGPERTSAELLGNSDGGQGRNRTTDTRIFSPKNSVQRGPLNATHFLKALNTPRFLSSQFRQFPLTAST